MTALPIFLGEGTEGAAYLLQPAGKAGIIEIPDTLAGRAAKGLRLFLEGLVIDAERGIVASDTEAGRFYVFEPTKGQFVVAFETVGANGEKAYRKTGDVDLGYLDGRGNKVQYSSHHFAWLFSQGFCVVVPATELARKAITEAHTYADADHVGRARILAAYDAHRLEFAADRATGRAEFRAKKVQGWDPQHPGCAKFEELWAGKSWPISVTVRRNGAMQVLKAANPAHARASWAWVARHDWVPTGEVKEAAW